MNVLTELESVLAEEQELLLTGNFGQLEALAEKKTELAEALSMDAPDLPEEAYEGLLNQAAHNEALLSSARRGIQAAISQLREYSSGGHQSTYSKEGQRQPLAKPTSVVQKY